MNILIALFSFALVLLCLFTLLVVMVQKPKGDGGLGAALGGGSMEAAFGAETGSLLQKITIYSVIGFFVLTFMLYLGNLASTKGAKAQSGESLLSEIVDEASNGDTSTGVTPDAAALQQILDGAATPSQETSTEGTQEAEASPGANAGEEASNP